MGPDWEVRCSRGNRAEGEEMVVRREVEEEVGRGHAKGAVGHWIQDGVMVGCYLS